MSNNKNKKIIAALVVFICFIFNSTNIFANTDTNISPETIAVSLVIDTSGSMKDTDPNNLRETAANVFIDLLSPDDYLSIITFDTAQEVVLPMQQIKTSDNKVSIKKALSEKVSAKGDTDYLVAFNEASKQLSSVNDGNVRKVILFLTDGKPEPDNTRKDDAEFMNSYMSSLWDTVSDLAVNKYEVYSVGFSADIDQSVLEKISSITQGSFKIANDSSDLALNFFDILGSLKNRKEFLNETFNLNEGKNIEFDLDEYTSQSTMVFISEEGKPFNIQLSAPDNKAIDKMIAINEADRYKIFTINQQNEKAPGKWKINVTGEGNIKAFGSKDLFIKPWIVSPENNSLHGLNEPLQISVNVTGGINENVSAEAVVTKDGEAEPTTVKLELNNGVFIGEYENVATEGKYDILIRLLLNGEVIAENKSSCFVRNLPVIKSDFLLNGEDFRLGESRVITSSLSFENNMPLTSNDITIENYNLVISYGNGETETISLLDNGSTEVKDTKQNDGIWSNKIMFNAEDSGKATLMVNGTYKGENLILEKFLGNFNVYPTGKLIIKPLNTDLYVSNKNKLEVPLEVENTSHFKETLVLSIDKSIGLLQQDKIEVEPLSKVNINVDIDVDKDLESKEYDLTIKAVAKDNQTVVEPGEISTKFTVLSKSQAMVMYFKNNTALLLLLVSLFLVIPLIIVLFGLILNKTIASKKAVINGKLLYWKEDDLNLTDQKEFNISEVKKDKIIISFNEYSQKADLLMPNSEYIYDIELVLITPTSRFKFIKGYKALFSRKNISELELKTTMPGIFVYEGKVYSSKNIYDGDRFSSGGYVFEYYIGDSKYAPIRGKDILIDKDTNFALK